MQEAYVQGFIQKCAEAGVDPETLVKQSFVPAWGGQSKYIGPERGIGLDLGYTYELGMLPVPKANLRFGDDRFGVGVGPFSTSIDMGRKPGRGFEASSPRSVWKLLADKVRERRAVGE